MNKDNVAYQLSLKSRECVRTHNKAGWLGMFAEDGIIEDPIGKSMLDPDGKGHHTPQMREAFWDRNIANSDIDIEIKESFTSDLECANVLVLRMVIRAEGKRYSQEIHGIFTYKANAAGKLLALRGYWEFAEGAATFKEI